jgi:hypothetical protein
MIYWPHQVSWDGWDGVSSNDWDWGSSAYVSGIGDVTPLGLAVPGIGAQQLFGWNPFSDGIHASDGGRGLGRGRGRSDWAGVAMIGAVVAVGVLGFLAFRHARVAAGTIRGVRSAFHEESSI